MKIYQTTKCDTRALDPTFDIKDVESDTLKHKLAVENACSLFAIKLIEQARNHDFTKLGNDLPAFYASLLTRLTGEEFYKLPWWEKHITSERHHLNDRCPTDVNLIDVIEMLADCVCAGKARQGVLRPVIIDDEILQRAVKNTIELFDREIEVDNTNENNKEEE